MDALEQLVARNRDKISRRLAEIDKAMRAYRQRGDFGNLADVWVLEKERRKLKKVAAKLRAGGNNVCPFCGGVKSTQAKSCGSCRSDASEAAKEKDAIAAHTSDAAQKLLARLPKKRVDKHIRAFRRWRRWRRKYMRNTLCVLAEGKKACACGAHKELCAKMCITCQDAKNILKKRIKQGKRDNRDEPPISKNREPRVLRLLTPGVYESDPGNGWDDIIKIVEENR